ncbi:MAG: DNA-directed RNA polymerase subunit beta [bacterium]
MSAKNNRKYFTVRQDIIPLPDLIEAQKRSYQWFLDEGLKELFDEVSPIVDVSGRELELYFLDYYLDESKFDENVSKEKNITYEAPLRVKAKLINRKTGESREQEIYLGDFPLITAHGTFVVNGIERVVVSQLIRSPGVFFTSEFTHDHYAYGAKIIPNRGAWLEIETDANNVLWVKIDRKRKVAITSLLRAFGYGSDEEVLDLFKEEIASQPGFKEYLLATIEKDIAKTEAEGLKEVYKRIRPGDLATTDNARSLIHSMFLRFDRYDFSRVGRYKLNQRFGLDLPNDKEHRVLRREDLAMIIKEVIFLNITQDPADDIDHLGNRRVRTVGELIQNKFRVGLARMERIVKDRMSTLEISALTPGRLINAKPIMGAVKEFFMSSQLSQFMDQVNPLAELEHKRRLSAMGPGGLSRERAGFDVRDVHPTHYGRICPIATSEGPNIGLVGHLSSFAHINDFGFIETPFVKVIKEALNQPTETAGKIVRKDILNPADQTVIVKAGEKITPEASEQLAKITDLKIIPIRPMIGKEIVMLDAFTEERYITTSANTPVDGDGYFIHEKEEVRRHGEPAIDYIWNIDYMDVSPGQIVSVATALIPFLEHDDATRALMGTNMQRQAVPCVKPQAPIIGTGVEGKAARDSGYAVICAKEGEVTEADGQQVQVLEKGGNLRNYKLKKFIRSNAATCINQRPVVAKGDKVKAGDFISDGSAIDQGELALGQNLLVAFMSWQGYNYEDAVVISERVVQQDRFTSIHIENYVIDVRDTKLGPEVVTNDIPNIGEEKLKNLDEEGIVRLGAEVSSGDILVGKITPKGETELSAEEKLLRVIFGEKARDVRDSSLYLEHGEHGKVIGVKIFSQAAADRLPAGVIKSIQVTVASLRKIQRGDKMAGRHGNKGVISKIVPVQDMPFLADGTPIDIVLSPLGVISRMNLGQILETHLGIAAYKLGYKVATPPLNGVSEQKIKEELVAAGLDESGKTILYDGVSGESFDNQVTVGVIYMMKLNHMVEDKIHQRSTGPYSLITQQPLGGKAQFGGQRFGEMEVWALEGYGAAYTLQEVLTIKSDDVPGRSKAYESIIKNEPIKKVNVPESFNVLVRELKGLCLGVELLQETEESRLDSTRPVVVEKDPPTGGKKEKNIAK